LLVVAAFSTGAEQHLERGIEREAVRRGIRPERQQTIGVCVRVCVNVCYSRRGERNGRLCAEHTGELIENFQAFPHIIALLEYALFSSEIFWKIDTVAFLFVFDKYCPIID